MFMGISAMFMDMNVGVRDAFIVTNNRSVAHAGDSEGDLLQEVDVVGYKDVGNIKTFQDINQSLFRCLIQACGWFVKQ